MWNQRNGPAANARARKERHCAAFRRGREKIRKIEKKPTSEPTQVCGWPGITVQQQQTFVCLSVVGSVQAMQIFHVFFLSLVLVGRSVDREATHVCALILKSLLQAQQTTVSRKWTHSSKTYPRRRNFVESIWIGKFRFRCFCLFFPFVVCVARTFSFESSSKHYNSDFVSHVHFV